MLDHTDRLSIADAVALIETALIVNFVSAHNARSVARALVAAEVDGQVGHGFSRVAAYAAQAGSGKVTGAAIPSVERKAPAYAVIDAGNGFAFPAIDLAIDLLSEMSSHNGIAGVAITRSHHGGQLGAHVERLAEKGMVALMFANTPKAMAPWGGDKPLFGTNPIAFAAPRQGMPPLVIDLSLSKVARGKVMAAEKKGEAIPPGWALDAQGKPTTDPQAALAGSMIPAGDAKGAALALMVEILAATLTGANHSFEASSFFDAAGNPPGVGQFIIAIDTQTVCGARFAPRLEQLVEQVHRQPGTRLPGSGRIAKRQVSRNDGIAIDTNLLAEIRKLADT